jgi:PhnB protein
VQLTTYLNYRGNCEQAFEYYEQHLDGKISFLMRHGEQPDGDAGQGGPEWKGKVLHARLELAGTALLGADVPTAEPMRSAYLTLTLDSTAEAERVYALLAEGGEVFMPLAETFFATRFAMLRDRFGTPWMLMHQKPQG